MLATVRYYVQMYLQLPLRLWDAGNVYLLALSSWKVNIAENPIAVMGCRLGCTASKKRFTYSSFDLDLGFLFSKTTFSLEQFVSLCSLDDAKFFNFDDDRHIKS